jgi:predicted HTH domain antitoxin
MSIEITLPRELLMTWNLPTSYIQQKTREWIVLDLYRDGSISAGKAAEFLGMSKGHFLDMLHQRNIPYLNWNDEELAQEVAVATMITPGA